jgi:hypothetical protein
MKILSIAILALALSGSACKEPVLPTSLNVVQVVITDLQNNVSETQMEIDVCNALSLTSPSATQACDVGASVLADIVTYLIDSGTISGSTLDNAKKFAAAHPKAAGASK